MKTKIEEYREKSNVAAKIIADLNKAQGFNAVGNKDPNNDKYQIDFYNNKVWDSDIQVWFHAAYGYYGSSNGYTACSPELQPYLIKALNHYKIDIVNYIMKAVEDDKRKALLDCKTEAEEILAEINRGMNKTE